MSKIKQVFLNWKVILLVIVVLLSLIAIKPSPGVEGVAIRNVAINSSASLAGIENPDSRSNPLAKERIISFNGEVIDSVEEYYDLVSNIGVNRTVRLETDKKLYTVYTKGNLLGEVDLGLNVYEAPSSNLRKGLDLEGGTRVLLEPASPVSDDDVEIILDNIKERLNVYGLGDVVVRKATDLEGSNFILIEMAGVTEEEVKELLAKQGKFEAMVGNETVFFGGKKDVTYVCRSAECSNIESCGKVEGGWACRFYFGISLSPEAAKKQAEATRNLEVIQEEGDAYLSEELILFLDDTEVSSLRIGAELKGRETTDVRISGSGAGISEEEAATNAVKEMKRLQTILITGSLPVKLEIVKVDTISPSLGKEFLDNVLLIGLLVLLSVVSVVFIRYRKINIVLPMIATLVSEVVIVLGFAALVGWNLDLASIAGMIIMIGTGVDHLIVITDEFIKGDSVYDWKEKLKRAMFIVMAAYFTTCVGMIPLWFAGAGLLKGFAFTTIVGISFGVLIARPAYAAVIEKLLK